MKGVYRREPSRGLLGRLWDLRIRSRRAKSLRNAEGRQWVSALICNRGAFDRTAPYALYSSREVSPAGKEGAYIPCIKGFCLRFSKRGMGSGKQECSGIIVKLAGILCGPWLQLQSSSLLWSL